MLKLFERKKVSPSIHESKIIPTPDVDSPTANTDKSSKKTEVLKERKPDNELQTSIQEKLKKYQPMSKKSNFTGPV